MNIRSKEIYLTIEQVAQLLNLPEVTIQRWEHQGKIPSKLISDNVMFKKSEIINWAQIHDLAIHEQNIAADSPKIFSLSQAIKKGSIYNNIEGNDVYTVFQNVLKELPFISNSIYQQVLEALIDREELNSTGIGNGIAIPHTRNRMDIGIDQSHVSVFFLDTPVKFSAIDDEAVFVLFMIFTASVKEHLKILSKISYMLQKTEVKKILQQRNKEGNLIASIEQLEDDTH